jgi:selenocysteine lyase/cysteine desulfurase
VEHVYDAAATLLGCHREEIAVVENATRAWDMAFYAVPLGPGDRILTAVAEYASNYIAFLQVAREAEVLYLLDACQSIGQLPIDVKSIGCDMLSATGLKYLRGPRGTGLLYVRREILDRLEPPFLDLHAAQWVTRDRFELRPDTRRFENWETSYAGKIGLGVAIEYALQWGIEAIWARIQHLAEALRRQLHTLTGVTVRDEGVERCGLVSFTVAGSDADAVHRLLARAHINVSVSRVSSTRLDMEARGLPDLVRASVHYYNTEEEIERLCRVLAAR